MTLPSKQEVKGVIVRILTHARDEGRLGELTVRIVLHDLATHYGIEEDVFYSNSYKPFIKATVHATVASFGEAPEGEGEAPRPEKNDSDRVKGGKRKRSSVQFTDEEPLEEAEVSESDARPSKRGSARSKPSKARDDQAAYMPPKSTIKTSKKPESETKYKSKAIIESSDEEAEPESGARRSAASPRKKKSPVKSSPPKHKQKQQKANKDHSDVEMDTGEGPGPSSASSQPMLVTESPKSSVVDEPRTKGKKNQEKVSTKPQRDEKTKRSKKEPLSKDEETVNRLKGIVLACGVRKVWKKEFEGLDKPSRQIKRLHSILGDLGMTPRYSLEKAKAIREERELAQELKDVQEFDNAVKRRGEGPSSSSQAVQSMDQDDNDVDVPARKKQSARASIMAFLQDQSEEE